MDYYLKTVNFLQQELGPKFEIRYKDESLLMKILGLLAFFNKGFMTDFTTAWGRKVYFPNRKFVEENPTRAAKILAHEYVHIYDGYQGHVRYSILYAAPQGFALVFLVSFIVLLCTMGVAHWLPWAHCALGLLCASPLPAYWRARYEARGYVMSMACNLWRYGGVEEDTLKWIEDQFTGWGYYKMWPFKSEVRRWLVDGLDMLQGRSDPEFLGGSKEPYVKINKLFTE